jgi:hypothetical protein
MKNFQYKSKVFFWSGLVMLMLAGTVWAFNGGIVKIKSVFANELSGTCTNPGCYSEEWKANEILGDVSGYDSSGEGVGVVTRRYSIVITNAGGGADRLLDNGTVDDSFNGKTLEYFAVPGSGASTLSGNGVVSSNGLLYQYVNRPNMVVGWKVNGHVH